MVTLVTLDQFERTYGLAMRRLLDAGWGRADVEGLLADWPSLRLTYADDLAEEAWRVTEVGVTPDEARAWLRALCEVAEVGAFVMTVAAVDWVRAIGQQIADPKRLVSAYTEAAGGDPETAWLAYLAGVAPAELTAGLASGECSRDTLMVLAGLRQQAPASATAPAW